MIYTNTVPCGHMRAPVMPSPITPRNATWICALRPWASIRSSCGFAMPLRIAAIDSRVARGRFPAQGARGAGDGRGGDRLEGSQG